MTGGASSRARGKRGESAARDLLRERDFDTDDLTDGAAVADFTAIDRNGVAWSVEAKNCKSIDVPRFVAQAKRQAGRKRWMVLAHIEGSSSWLCLRQGEKPTVWTANEQ